MRRAANTSAPDSELVSRVGDGDPEAFALIVRRYSGALSALASSRLQDGEDVRDVVQEAFVIAYCTLDRIKNAESLGAWLRGIALNCCKQHLERQERRRRFLARYPQSTASFDPLAVAGARRYDGELHAAMRRLGELQREVVALFYFQDVRVDEIAGLIGRPPGTVKRILSDARSKLKEELIEMARNEFTRYRLTDEQRERLAQIPTFPRREPRIVAAATTESPSQTVMLAPRSHFPPREIGAQACFADYDWPAKALTSISHVAVQGPFEIEGRRAVRYDALSFSKDGRAEWVWRCCYDLDGAFAHFCAMQYGADSSNLELVTPGHELWREPLAAQESPILVPGERREPKGDQSGFEVDAELWEVRIGRRSFKCLRRVFGGDVRRHDWSDSPLTDVATEEFVLPDGRLLLWRRYNGDSWSVKNADRRGKGGCVEDLEKAGVPSLDVFGCRYRLWYDQIPEYALI